MGYVQSWWLMMVDSPWLVAASILQATLQVSQQLTLRSMPGAAGLSACHNPHAYHVYADVIYVLIRF